MGMSIRVGLVVFSSIMVTGVCFGRPCDIDDGTHSTRRRKMVNSDQPADEIMDPVSNPSIGTFDSPCVGLRLQPGFCPRDGCLSRTRILPRCTDCSRPKSSDLLVYCQQMVMQSRVIGGLLSSAPGITSIARSEVTGSSRRCSKCSTFNFVSRQPTVIDDNTAHSDRY